LHPATTDNVEVTLQIAENYSDVLRTRSVASALGPLARAPECWTVLVLRRKTPVWEKEKMPKSATTWLMVLGLTLAIGAQAPTQTPIAELKPPALRETIRELIPLMSRILDVKVFEPIPLEIVSRDQLKSSIARELEKNLLTIVQIVQEPTPVAKPVIFPDRARQMAEKVASRLASRFLIRFVFDEEAKLLIVPENLTQLLDPSQFSTRQIPPLIRFCLVRELTRMTDDDRYRYSETQLAQMSRLEHFTARVAFLEGRAWWAASRLVRQPVKALPPYEAELPAIQGNGKEIEQLLYAYIGKGRERARLWTNSTVASGGLPALRRLLDKPPVGFGSFPHLPSDKPVKARTSDPLAEAADAIKILFGNQEWTSEQNEPTKKMLCARLEAELPARDVKSLLAGLKRLHETTATHPENGQIHLSLANLTNASAAFAWYRAEEQRLSARTKKMSEEGYSVDAVSKRTHDLPGFPVLVTSKAMIETGNDTMTVYRMLAVYQEYFIAVSTVGHPLDWPTVRDFLKEVKTRLGKGEKRRSWG